MCDYCEEERTIFEKEIISENAWAWCFGESAEINLEQAKVHEDTYSLFIDRGYLRFVDKDDSMCLDHGWKIKINYCPCCGREL